MFGRLTSLEPITSQIDLQFNEVIPLLYSCLKIDIQGKESDNMISSLDSFLKYDIEQELLGNVSFQTVSLIARIYTADSMNYPH